jgi:ABC-type Mn2+/Zn2+ transport system ATPase subunit
MTRGESTGAGRAGLSYRFNGHSLLKLIIGPPGSGKGTQAELISGLLDVVAISTGDIFRANVTSRTKLGMEAMKYMDEATSFQTPSPTRWCATASVSPTSRAASCWTATRAPPRRLITLTDSSLSEGKTLTLSCN